MSEEIVSVAVYVAVQVATSSISCPMFQSDELACQKKLRTELIQLEDQLSQVRREYEMLRIEFEQTLAANEQTGTKLMSMTVYY